MPNWCCNFLTVRAKSIELVNAPIVRMQTENGAFDVGLLIPYPQEFRDRDREFAAAMPWRYSGVARDDVEQYSVEHRTAVEQATQVNWGSLLDGYNSGGYDWCVDNWGTKWPPSDVRVGEAVERKPGMFLRSLTMDTAWTPLGDKLLSMWSAEFPDVSILHRYYERGVGYAGRDTYRKGERLLQLSRYDGSYVGSRGG